MIWIEIPGEELEIYMRCGPRPIKSPSSSPNQIHMRGSIKNASIISHKFLLPSMIKNKTYAMVTINDSERFQVIGAFLCTTSYWWDGNRPSIFGNLELAGRKLSGFAQNTRLFVPPNTVPPNTEFRNWQDGNNPGNLIINRQPSLS